MTVRINKPALNLREELTKAQGVVRYEQRQFWMDGLVENGTFDSDLTGWTDASGGSGSASVSSSELLLTSNSSSDRGIIRQAISVEQYKRYKFLISFTSSTNSTNYYRIGYNIGTLELVSASSVGVGVYEHTFVSTGSSNTAYLQIAGIYGSGTVTVDNVQVFEVDENDNVIQSLPLGWKPLHVYEDGLLQREGTNHDYTVVKTGGAYAIKPAVQPTGSTETCVIAEREL